MAETDPYFESAARNVVDNTKAMLAAIAEGGSAGLAAYKTARSGIESARTAALTRAGQRATDMGIAGAPTDSITGAFDERLASLGSAQAGFTSGLEATKSSNRSYMDKVSASLPFLREANRVKIATRENEIQRYIAMAQQQAAADAAEQAAKEQAAVAKENRSEQRSIDRENRSNARSTRSSARSSAPAELSDSELKVRLGGAADEAMRQEAARPHKYVQPRPAIASFSRSQIARSLGADAGLDPYQVAGLFPDEKAAASDPILKQLATGTKLRVSDVSAALADPDYQKQLGNVRALFAAGQPWDVVDAALRTDLLPKKTRSYAVLQYQFRDMFSRAGLLK